MSTKHCLITGGSGLIGVGIAKRFLSAKYQIHLVDLTEPEGELKSQVHFHQIDVGSEEDVQRLAQKISTLDVLINNAALADPVNAPVSELKLSDWDKVIRTNLTAYFLFAKHFTEHLKRTEGCIVNVSSTRALMSEPHNEAYAATKGGILALTHALAGSLGPKIRANAISPGWIADPKENLSKKDHAQHPAGRVGRPEDIAEMAYFLASENAKFITGANFVVDGGMTHKMIYEE